MIRFKSSPAFDDFLNQADTVPPIDFEPVAKLKEKDTSVTTINQSTLIEAVSNQTGLSIKDVTTFMTTFITTSQATLSTKESLTLTHFGTFETVYHKEKKMVVPATKEEKIIPGYYTVKFKPSKAFTTVLNEN